MKLIGYGAALALAISAGVSAQQRPAVSAGSYDKDITLTGCVVKGDGGFVLANVAEPSLVGSMAEPSPTTGSVAATTSAALASRTLYWLQNNDELEEHAGQKVEVTGKFKGNLDKGAIEVAREGDFVEIKFKAEGQDIKVKVPDVPAAVGTSGVNDKEQKVDVVVRKIEVKSVKMLASSCS
jgi:hypothetical protein